MILANGRLVEFLANKGKEVVVREAKRGNEEGRVVG